MLTADESAIGARAILESCCRLSIALLRRGLLLRGGLTVGNVIHESTGLLYGSGMIEAYRLDERGIPPRISLTDAACSSLETLSTDAFRRRYVTTDTYDLSKMVHALQSFARIGRSGAKHDRLALRNANEIAAVVRQQATNLSLTPANRAKWRWLQGYWNSSMTKYQRVEQA